MADHEDMKDYHVFRWRSCISLSVDYFKTLLQDPAIESGIDKEFPTRIGERSRELQRLGYRIDFLLLPLVILLGAFDSELVQDISILGVSLSRDNASLGVLLLVSSILWMLSSAVSTMSYYYGKLLEGYISVKHDERIISFHIHQFQWNIQSIFDTQTNKTFNVSHNVYTAAIVGLWILSAIFAAVIIKILVLLIFAGATISTFEITSMPDFVKLPIVALAACAIVFDITCLLVLCPLPFTDYSNIEKLKKLDQANPDLAEKIRVNIATRELARDRRNSIFLQAIVLSVFVIVPNWIVVGNDLFTQYEIVLQVLLGLAVMSLTISPIVGGVERWILGRAFQMEDRESSLKLYIGTKKQVWRARLILAAAVGLTVFLWLN